MKKSQLKLLIKEIVAEVGGHNDMIYNRSEDPDTATLAKQFTGKTIKSIDVSHEFAITFIFTDGTSLNAVSCGYDGEVGLATQN
jgi:hypothetical protein